MPQDLPLFPSGPQVRDYLAVYRHHFGLDVREGVQVHSASWSNGRWRLHTSEGELTTGSLVAATGIWSRPVYPDIPGLGDVSGTLVHSAQYRSAEQLRGRRVLVVGAGNSGCEIAVGLVGVADAVHLSVHGEALFVPRPSSALFSRLSAPLLRRLPVRLASVLIDRVRPDLSDIGLPPPDLSASTYPVVGLELPDAVRQGRVEVVGALSRFEGDTAVFADGASRSVDAVVLATGFGRRSTGWTTRSTSVPTVAPRSSTTSGDHGSTRRCRASGSTTRPPRAGCRRSGGCRGRRPTGSRQRSAAPEPRRAGPGLSPTRAPRPPSRSAGPRRVSGARGNDPRSPAAGHVAAR